LLGKNEGERRREREREGKRGRERVLLNLTSEIEGSSPHVYETSYKIFFVCRVNCKEVF
jgi:hypothetical protein